MTELPEVRSMRSSRQSESPVHSDSNPISVRRAGTPDTQESTNAIIRDCQSAQPNRPAPSQVIPPHTSLVSPLRLNYPPFLLNRRFNQLFRFSSPPALTGAPYASH